MLYVAEIFLHVLLAMAVAKSILCFSYTIAMLYTFHPLLSQVVLSSTFPLATNLSGIAKGKH